MVLKYGDIVRTDKGECLKKSLESMSEFLMNLPQEYQKEVERELVKQIGIFADGHFTKESAGYCISKMKPSWGTKTMEEILAEKGVTYENAKQAIHEAYDKANAFAIQRGFNAPKIPEEYNEYDYYVALAMCIADFWYNGEQDPTNYSMLAYQWMSDVDASCTKVWDYFSK